MQERLDRMSAGQMADPSASHFTDPASWNSDPIVHPTLKNEMYLSLIVKDRSVLLVGSAEVGDPFGDRVVSIGHFDVKPLERTVPDVAPAYQLQIGTSRRIQAQRIVQIQEGTPLLNEGHNRLLLLQGHPGLDLSMQRILQLP